MGTTFYELPIGEYFEDNIEGIRASINSAIDYAFDRCIDQIHVLTFNPELIINECSDFNIVDHFKTSGRAGLSVVIIQLRSAEIQRPHSIPTVEQLLVKHSKSESQSLILSFLEEKIYKANNNGWDSVVIKHKIPENIVKFLESEKHYKVIAHDDYAVISWEV